MSISIIADGTDIPVEHIKFSDGGSNLRVLWPEGFTPERYINISVHPSTPVDSVLWLVQLTVCALESQVEAFAGQWGLNLPYLPHGRADRRFDKHCSFPLETFLYSVSRHFTKVYLTDPHSSYAEDTLNGCGVQVYVREQHECYLELKIPFDRDHDLLICPDEGALPKIRSLTSKLGGRYAIAHKTRDKLKGRVTSTTLQGEGLDYQGKRCVIVDDICDGGGTFLPLAKALKDKGAASVELYVTHGIFAKGLEPFKGLIDKLHVYQIVSNYISREDLAQFNNTSWSEQ